MTSAEAASSDAMSEAALSDAPTEAAPVDGGADTGSAGDLGDGGPDGAIYACGSPSVITVPSDCAVEGGAVPLFDVGQGGAVTLLQSGDRVLATDAAGAAGWTLWDTPTRSQVARGPGSPLGISDSLFLTGMGLEAQVRALSDGHLQATLPDEYSISLASDGSYVWGLSETAITVWSPDGTQLFSRAGNYYVPPIPSEDVQIYAAPSQLMIGAGPAGKSVVEYLAVPSGTESVSPPFSGTFNTWFVDGSHFLTNQSSTIWVYASDATQVEIVGLPGLPVLGGYGNFFWGYAFEGSVVQTLGPLNVYAIGGGSTPIATYGTALNPPVLAFPGSTIGFLQGGNLEVIQLGSPIADTIFPLPLDDATVLAMDSGGRWSVADRVGLVYQHGTTSDAWEAGFLGCGPPVGLGASKSGTAVLSTQSGALFVVDTASGAVTPEGGNVVGTHLALSDDGTVLAAFGAVQADLDTLSLPGASLLQTFTGTSDFRLSTGGTRIGFTLGSSAVTRTQASCSRKVTDPSGAVDAFDDTGFCPTPRLSPSGTYIAVTDLEHAPSSTTRLYQGSTLLNVIPGYAVGWIDDDDLLVQTWKTVPVPIASEEMVYVSSAIYSNQGSLVTALASLPEVDDFYVLSPTQILSRTDSNVYDVTTGALVRSTGLPSGFAYAGGSAVYTCDSILFRAPF